MSGVSGAGPLGVVDSGFLGSGQQRAVPIPTVAANQPPVANGGPDRTAPLGSLATLDGRASSDPDGGPAALAFSWTQSSGPAVTLLDATTATPRFTPSAAGSYTFTLVVSDGPASSAPDDVTVTVACTAAYGFTGVFPSVDNPPVYNEATAGPAIPVKFSLGGDQGLGIFATGYPSSALVACASSELTDAFEETLTVGTSSLQYDASADQYVYVWKTSGTWANT
ncbi:MAG TPA: PxKF domain-containing protein [Methylomirabilota bacterium]|nr:PxKF domain-containing protein [Methylomirabilota bacterium]